MFRVSRIRRPASTASAAAALAPGTSKPTKPAPVTVNPVSPRLRIPASTTVAAVWYEETTLAPASDVASAATCASPARAMVHAAVVAEKASARTTSMDTAEASEV